MMPHDPTDDDLFPPERDGKFPSVAIDDDYIPMVEVAVAPRRGFGFIKAFLWSLLFLVLTQILPAVIIIPSVLVTDWTEIKETISSIGDSLKDQNGKVDQMEFFKQMLGTPIVRRIVQLTVLSGPLCGVFFALIFMPRVVGRDWVRRVGVRLPHFEHVVLVGLLSLPILVFSTMLESLLTKQLNDEGSNEMRVIMESMATWPWLILVMGIAVGPAISEELFCRGFLGQGLVGRYGTAIGILVTSFYFGLIHMNLLQGIFAFAIGIVLHLIYIASRSIFIPMLLHFINNFVVITAISTELPLPVGKSLEDAIVFSPYLMAVASTLMVAAISWAMYATRVRIYLSDGREAPPRMYPHVQEPQPGSANQAVAGAFPNAALLAAIVSTGFFAAVWFGL